MFSLHVNNNEIYLAEEFNFGMVLESPLFNTRGNYSYPFTVPYEPNKHFFSHLKELSSNDPELPIPFEIRWNDIVQLAGEVSKYKYYNEEIELTLIGAKSLFRSKFVGKYLDEIDMGTEDYTARTPENLALMWANSAKKYFSDSTWPNFEGGSKYTFAPMYVENFFNENSSQIMSVVNPVINKIDPTTGTFEINQNYPGGTICCMNLYLYYVIEKLIEYSGYKINRNDLDLNGPGLFNIISIDIKRIYFASWARLRYQWLAGKVFELKHALPHTGVADLLDGLESWIGLYINSDDISQTVDIVLNREILKDDRIETRLNRSVISTKHERETYTPPGITLKYAMSGDDFNGNMNLINPDESYPTVNTFDELPTPNVAYLDTIYEVSINSRYYNCVAVADTDPQEYKWRVVGEFAPVTVGDNPEERSTNIGTHLTDLFKINFNVSGESREAEVELPFCSNSFGYEYGYVKSGISQKPDFGISFLIFKGLKQYLTTDEYLFEFPASGYDKFPIKGNLPNGWLSFKLTGTRGIYQNFNVIPTEWEINHKRPVCFFIDLPPAAVFALDFMRKYQLDDLSFHLNKININFTRKRISSVRLECYYASGGNMELPQHYLLIDEDGHRLLIDGVNKLLID